MLQLFKRFIKFSLNYLRRVLLFFKNNTLPKPENLEVKINNFVDQKKLIHHIYFIRTSK